MNRRAFWIGSWASLVAGAVAAMLATALVIIGVLSMAGSVTYPVNVGVGPFSLHHEVSIPVGLAGDVCQSASVREQSPSGDCFTFFVHDEGWIGSEAVRHQDADLRPTSVELAGEVELETTGGWSGFVAASVARDVVGLTVASAVLILLWRLLAGAAEGAVFSSRAVTYVRALGWVLIAGSLAEAVLGLFSATQLGYSVEMFGVGPHLALLGTGGISVVQLLLGGLILLLGEVFRHGAAVEDERRLTV